MAMSRLSFLSLGAVTTVPGKAKPGDGVVSVSYPEPNQRGTAALPAGAGSHSRFVSKCVGCRLCVSACGRKVLRVSKRKDQFLLPEMDFTYGWCSPSCTRCGSVCPTGAIERVESKDKRSHHVGLAVWHADRCIAKIKGETCKACFRHCPVKAITLVDGLPKVDAEKCIGCGACEHYCPARPKTAMVVEGVDVHRVGSVISGGSYGQD